MFEAFFLISLIGVPMYWISENIKYKRAMREEQPMAVYVKY